MSNGNAFTVEVVEMTPAEAAYGGRSLAIDYVFAPTPFGKVLLGATAKGVCCLFFADHEHSTLAEMKAMLPNASYTERMTPQMEEAFAVLDGASCGQRHIPLHLKGTPFQLSVWRALLEIPCGKTIAYGEMAARVGRPRASRAAGSAVGANPVSVIVPCHRVVRTGGGLGGYRWGIERKKAILESELEGVVR